MSVPGRKATQNGSQKVDSEEEPVHDLLCQPCSDQGIYHEATGYCQDCQEHLCSECFGCHLRPRPMRHHKLLDKSQMPRNVEPANIKAVADVCTEKCDIHQGKIVEYYCEGHGQLGCCVCMTIDHRRCDGVRFIPDIAHHFDQSKEYLDFKKNLKDREEEFETLKTAQQKRIVLIERVNNMLLDGIRAFRKEILEELNNLKEQTERVQRAVDKDKETMGSLSERCEILTSDLDSINSGLKNKETSKQQGNLFITVKKFQTKVEQTDKQLENIREAKLNKYEEIDDLVRSLKKLKDVVLKEKSENITELDNYLINLALMRTCAKDPIEKDAELSQNLLCWAFHNAKKHPNDKVVQVKDMKESFLKLKEIIKNKPNDS